MNNADVDEHAERWAAAPSATSDTTLSGRRLLVACIAWVVLVALSVVAFIMALPGYLASNQHPSSTNAALSPQAASALIAADITLETYAWMSFGIACVVVLVATIMALVLFWRRSTDWMALLVGLFLVIYTTSNVGTPMSAPTVAPNSVGAVLYAVFLGPQNVPGSVVPFGVFLLFPSGQFVPRWSRWLLVTSLVWAVALSAMPVLFDGLLFLGYPLFIGAVIGCMIYRYWRASTPVQRLQTKWVVTGLIVSLLANQAFWILAGFTPVGQTIYLPLAYLVYQVVLLLVPITFFIAIQRYRLYEIDTLINRALVYGSLTAVLAGIYAAGVIGVQALVGGLSGKAIGQQPVIVVATTLLIAALFRPLRARLQSEVDRRFYRRKYDAAKTLDAFSAMLRQDVELTELRQHVVEAVDETMQPAHVSLWLVAQPTATKMAAAQDAHPRSEGGDGTRV